ncbi:MAG: acyl-CoA dehydrogenase family protein [Robiginitomaculum sp.]|nr:acyl-CoA dehydrogenase family protein [Robiginitomaculum sp.]
MIKDEINPYVDQWEEEGIFPAHKLFKTLGNAGLLGINKPEKFGGMGLDYGYNVAFVEALGDINCGGVPMAIGVQTDMATPILAIHGSDALRSEFLAPAIAGDQVACIGVSEPSAGSDVAAIKTYARSDGDDFIINGQKMWITNAIQADFMTALVNTGDGGKYENKSLIIIPMDSKGVIRAKKLDKLGMRSSDTGLIYFEDVRVPKSNVIGQENMGFIYQMQQFQEERLWAAASTVRALETTITDTIDYAQNRMIYGKPLLDNQVVHFRLAEMMTEVEMFRGMLEKTVARYLKGDDMTKQVSMLKLKTGRLSREITDACLQYYGGMGFMSETRISRQFRDQRLGSIGGGADEVMLSIICKYMGILPSGKKK